MLTINNLQAITTRGTPKNSYFNRVLRAVRVGANPKEGEAHTVRYAIKDRIVLFFFVLSALVAGSGCSQPAEKKSVPSSETIAEAMRVFDDSAPESPVEPQPAEEASGFAVLLSAVPARLAGDPDLALEQIAGVFGDDRDRVWLYRMEKDRPPFVVYGRYSDPGSEEAQADLSRIREMRVQGRAPFARAIMMPVDRGPRAGSQSVDSRLARNDLRNAKKLFGADAVYTLQIGVYAREDKQRPTAEDLAAFRKAAEDAVARLRREGEQAFYYHGPNGSMVTVGIFNDSDLDTSVTPPIESARLKAARAKHPNNLLNGRGVREMVRNGSGEMVPRLQESRLVLIPD